MVILCGKWVGKTIIFWRFEVKIGWMKFLPKYIISNKTNNTISLEKDSQGVNLIASPKQPQSVTLL